MNADFTRRARDILGAEGCLAGDDVSDKYATDWSRDSHVRPPLVLRPATVQQLSDVLKLCNAERQPIVVQGGLTGLCAGASPRVGEVALSTERLNRIEALDPIDMTLTVQAGVTLERAQQAAEKAGLALQLDFGARGSCTIGGNLATNAGGNSVIRYGVARGLVLGLEAVLADGTVLSSMNRMLKNSSGYDLKQLFIGSEGTLGVISRAVLRLEPALAGRATALVSADSFDGVIACLVRARSQLGAGLTAFEVMWRDYVEAVHEACPQLRHFTELPGAYQILIEAQSPKTDGEAQLEAFLESAIDANEVTGALVAQSEREADDFWQVRDGVSEVVARIPHPLSFDVSMPIREMPEYCATITQRIRDKLPGTILLSFGHLGDGTLHVVVGPPTAADRPWLVETMLAPVPKHHGAISAEHGIGQVKKHHLYLSRTPAELELMRRLKAVLDPNRILNIGRVID